MAVAAAIGLVACGDAGVRGGGQTDLSGQVTIGGLTPPPAVSHHAASRFLEHASMGPSPDSVARVRAIGQAAWIDEQMRKPVSRIVTPSDLIDFDQVNDQATNGRAWDHFGTAILDQAVGSEDQLRHRVAWVLSNFLVTSARKVNPYGVVEYWNTLMSGAFGSYGDLLKAITLSPAMGHYLDNNQNRRYALNENYGRELLQLFSVGTILLNADGTPKRDASGRTIETYNQQDVIETTRALTGWDFTPNPANETVRNNHNFANYGKPMVVRQEDDHDKNAKKVLGSAIAAGNSAVQDLDALVRVLMAHPNIAPFVSLRLIQGLTTSDPSPAYMRRVTAVFQQTGGNVGAVVRAILLDPEARQGDDPARTVSGFGRIREPHLLNAGMMRAMGCRKAIRSGWRPTQALNSGRQQVLNSETVFNFYPPNHRAPGSNLLAPEQKMLDSEEFQGRLGRYNGFSGQGETHVRGAGCEVDVFTQALAKSDDAFLDLLAQRFYRGAMPPPIRLGLKEALASRPWIRSNPLDFLGSTLSLVSSTPPLGAVK